MASTLGSARICRLGSESGGRLFVFPTTVVYGKRDDCSPKSDYSSSMTTSNLEGWSSAYVFLLLAPVLGGSLLLLEPPSYLQVLGIMAIIALVFAGTASLFVQRRN